MFINFVQYQIEIILRNYLGNIVFFVYSDHYSYYSWLIPFFIIFLNSSDYSFQFFCVFFISLLLGIFLSSFSLILACLWSLACSWSTIRFAWVLYSYRLFWNTFLQFATCFSRAFEWKLLPHPSGQTINSIFSTADSSNGASYTPVATAIFSSCLLTFVNYLLLLLLLFVDVDLPLAFFKELLRSSALGMYPPSSSSSFLYYAAYCWWWLPLS